LPIIPQLRGCDISIYAVFRSTPFILVAYCCTLVWGEFLLFPSPGRQDLPQSGNAESDPQRVTRLFRTGSFDEAAKLAKQIDDELGKFSVDERWPLIEIQSLMRQGRYPAARESLSRALERFPKSIRIRWLGAEVCRFNRQSRLAKELQEQVGELFARGSWRYRDVENQIVIAQFLLSRKQDAKQVMDRVLKPIRDLHPKHAVIYQAIGDLALEKNDYGMAAENYLKAVELRSDDPELHYGLAEAYRPSDFSKCRAALDKALSIDGRHVPSLLLIADQHISSENYADAADCLQLVLSVNPEQPRAWAYKAVLAHLDNQPHLEADYRNRALSHWDGNPEIDHLIGRELSEKYRFKESASYQRRALIYDPDYLPAKFQLAHDLLRLGQELEGWKLADEVFDADQYNVVAHNLVTLRNEISKFRTLKGDGFVVRMETEESYIYGSRVMELLREAKDVLVEKYGVDLETPIFVEIFPRQQDFAIRTFGLPGGDGFLGVCFGRLITMNSPAAQGANLTSWESVLWHEFCHVVTLQKTKNRMPRWLSEGISVYEEGLKNPAWGESLNPEYRKKLLDERLTPVSQLSGAFLNPKTPLDLQFAYFESALVVEYLVQEFGEPALNQVLDELAVGTPINDSLRRHVAPMPFLDKKFSEFARNKAKSYAAAASWKTPEVPADATIAQWKDWNQRNPDNVPGLLQLATKLRESGQLDAAIEPLERVLKLDPSASLSAYSLLAGIYRDQKNLRLEKETLQKRVALDADSTEPMIRLLELTIADGEWESAKHLANRLLAVNPLLPAAHRYLSLAAEKTSDDATSVSSLSALTRLNPLDRADVHFRLASALFRQDELVQAKRHVLISLEHAPRYRDAHRLLLEIRGRLVNTEGLPVSSAPPVEKDPSQN
jgi:tetratricopeptide (TPR) repeat protein